MSTVAQLRKRLIDQEKEIWETKKPRVEVEDPQKPLYDAVRVTRKEIRAAATREHEAFMSVRPPVLDQQSILISPPKDVMQTQTKTEWFASLSPETYCEVINFGLRATRRAMTYEKERVEDLEGDDVGGFYEYMSDSFQFDIDLAANVTDDGEPWV